MAQGRNGDGRPRDGRPNNGQHYRSTQSTQMPQNPQPRQNMRRMQAAGPQRNPGPQRQQQSSLTSTQKMKTYYDFNLLFTVIFIFAMGLLIIYSSSQYTATHANKPADFYFLKQLRIGLIGLAGALVASKLDYRLLRAGNGILSKLAYGGSVGLLMFVQVGGIASHGKSRWINLAGQSFQPVELAKLGLIIGLAYFISEHRADFNTRTRLGRLNLRWKFWLGAMIGIVPFVFTVIENISSAFIVASITALMLFISSKDVSLFVVSVIAVIAGAIGGKPLVRHLILSSGMNSRPEQYWMRRIVSWAAPDIFPTDAYQTMQGLYAIGSGGITGHGLGESIQKFGKVPEVQNDMIFTIVCEEFGVIGAATLILVYIYILYRIYLIAVNAEDTFGFLLCVGVLCHLGMQVILNISVVTGVIPNTGVTLPFISYGGTAVLLTMLEMGMVLSVANQIVLEHR